MTKAKDIKKGFKTIWWTALEDARTQKNLETGKDETVIKVRMKDGGNEAKRVFDPEQLVGTGLIS
jgi:hypothetical protein